MASLIGEVGREVVVLAEVLLGHFGGQAQLLLQVRVGVVRFRQAESGCPVLHHGAVEVVAAQVGVAVGAQYLKNALLDAQDADVEGAAAEVVHGHGFLLIGAQANAVGQGGGGGLVHDAQYLQPGQAASVAGGLPLRVVEIGRHGNHGAIDGRFQGVLGAGAQLAQDVGRQFNGGVEPVFDPDFHQTLGVVVNHLIAQLAGVCAQVAVAFAQQALHRINGARRVGKQKLAGIVAHHGRGPIGREVHHRGHDRAPAQVVDGGRLAGFGVHVGHEAVGGAQVDAHDNFFLLEAAGGEVDSYSSHKVRGAVLRTARKD